MVNSKIRTIIVDDESRAIDLLKNLLKDYPEIEIIATANDFDSGYHAVLKHEPELLFLDIQMPQKSGIELAKTLMHSCLQPTIVFVTAYDQYAIEALKQAAYDYILKPINRIELKETILRYKIKKQDETVLNRLDQISEKLKHGEKIRFNTRTGYIMISPDKIAYCQSDGNYTDIFRTSGKKETITCNIGSLEKILPAYGFLRVSRFNIINLSYVTRVDRKTKTCELSANGTILKLSIPKKQMKLLEERLSAES